MGRGSQHLDGVALRDIRARFRNVSEVVGLSWPAYELLLIAVAIFIYVLLWIVGSPASFSIDLVFTMVIGNWAGVLTTLVRPFFVRRSFPWNWAIYLPFVVLVGVSGSLIADLILLAMAMRSRDQFLQAIRGDVRFGTLMTVVVGVTTFLVAQQKSRLDEKNRELQSRVQLGETESRARAAELDHAHEIQLHLLPRETPQLDGYQIACAWQPARTVSGDYFDVFPLTDGRMAICIADVSGKGMGAALLMANLQASVRAFADNALTPAQLCARLNTTLCNNIAPGKFVTLVYGILSPHEKSLVYENAGHCLPLILHSNGAVELPPAHGGVLGLFPEWTFQDHSIPLGSEDCLVLVTDGLLEAANRDEDEFGYERLVSVIRQNRSGGAYTLRQAILGEVSRFCEGAFQDDASLIVITVD